MAYLVSIITAVIVLILGIGLVKKFDKSPDQKLTRKTIVGAIILFTVFSMLGFSGIFENFEARPPRFFLLLPSIIIANIFIWRSQWARDVVSMVPLWVLVGFQGFRFMPEYLLHTAYLDGLAPIQMTWHGYNFDVLSAVIGILAGWWLARGGREMIAWIASVVGIVLLATILFIAVTSAPTPFRLFINEPANTFVASFPYILLPGVHVFLAILVHGLTIKKLLQARTQ